MSHRKPLFFFLLDFRRSRSTLTFFPHQIRTETNACPFLFFPPWRAPFFPSRRVSLNYMVSLPAIAITLFFPNHPAFALFYVFFPWAAKRVFFPGQGRTWTSLFSRPAFGVSLLPPLSRQVPLIHPPPSPLYLGNMKNGPLDDPTWR